MIRVGETWGYRARATDQLEPVEVIRIGQKTPRRVLVEWADEQHEGYREWVSPSRLKVPWADGRQFEAFEQLWAGVTASAPALGAVDDQAVNTVFGLLIDPDVAYIGAKTGVSVGHISDIDTLARFLDCNPAEVPQDQLHFTDQGALVVSWPTTLFIATTAARQHSTAVLQYVAAQEHDYSRKMTVGRYYPATKHEPEGFIEPDFYRQTIDEPHNRPHWQTLRRWAGSPFAVRHDTALPRTELLRARQVAREAIAALERAGLNADARRLKRALDPPTIMDPPN